MNRNSSRWNHGSYARSYVGLVLFMVGFAGLLVGVSYYFLFPAMEVIGTNPTATERRSLGAYSSLLLAVLLVILFIGMVMAFPISRFFFPRRPPPRTQTRYVDAWSESARRMPTPPADDEKSA